MLRIIQELSPTLPGMRSTVGLALGLDTDNNLCIWGTRPSDHLAVALLHPGIVYHDQGATKFSFQEAFPGSRMGFMVRNVSDQSRDATLFAEVPASNVSPSRRVCRELGTVRLPDLTKFWNETWRDANQEAIWDNIVHSILPEASFLPTSKALSYEL